MIDEIDGALGDGKGAVEVILKMVIHVILLGECSFIECTVGSCSSSDYLKKSFCFLTNKFI